MSDPNSSLPIQNVAVLGATGSIGTSTVDVINHLHAIDQEARWRLWAASGHRNLDCLVKMAESVTLPPEHLIVSDSDSASRFTLPPTLSSVNVETGADSLIRVAEDAAVDILVAAIVGRAGLESTLAAIKAGKRVALANKETLVVGGPLVSQHVHQSNAELLPVDSEHSAIFQCLKSCTSTPKRLILTASGGPFREWTVDQMRDASLESALAHPTWNMGRKISIDSATMMNKSLEVIEARWLFDIPAEKIDVVVHPQSIIHSMVEFEDGSVIAQLSPPDMRLPIQYALTYPRRLESNSPKMDITQSWNLDLQPADHDRFPALKLGFEVARMGGTAGAVVNAANEVAVGLFVNGQIRFTDIVTICQKILENHTFEQSPSLSRLLELDRWARQETLRFSGQTA